MEDAGVGGRHGGGLGVIGDPEARFLQHRDVVGAVANGQRFVGAKAELGGGVEQSAALAFRAQDRPFEPSVQPARSKAEPVGHDPVEADLGPDRIGEAGESSGDQEREGPFPTHRPHQRPGAAGEPDALRQAPVDGGLVEPGEKSDPLGKRRLEPDLTLHRPLGDVRDLGLDARIIGELVDAFDGNHGRIHVGDEQPPAPRGLALDDDVDSVDEALDRRPGRPRSGGEEQVAGLVLLDPASAVGRDPGLGERVGGGGNIPVGEAILCYQGGDEHGFFFG